MTNTSKMPYMLYGLAIIVLTVMVISVGFGEVAEVITRIHPVSLALLSILQVGTLLLTGYIWFFLIKKFNSTIPFQTVFSIHLAGKFVESVTPSVKLGGESAKVYLMRKRTDLTYQELTSIALVSKYFSLLPFLLVSCVVTGYTFFMRDLPMIAHLSFLGLVLMLILFLLFLKLGGITPTRITGKIDKSISFMKQAAAISRKLVKTSNKWQLMSIGFLVWILYPIKVFLAARMLGFDISVFVLVIATFTAYLISMFPLLPGGIGSFEGSMALVFTSFGLTGAEGLSIALVTRFITFWFPLVLSALVSLIFVKQGVKDHGSLRT